MPQGRRSHRCVRGRIEAIDPNYTIVIATEAIKEIDQLNAFCSAEDGRCPQSARRGWMRSAPAQSTGARESPYLP